MEDRTRLDMDTRAAEELRQAARELSAQERRTLTLGDAVRHLIAAWRGRADTTTGAR